MNYNWGNEIKKERLIRNSNFKKKSKKKLPKNITRLRMGKKKMLISL